MYGQKKDPKDVKTQPQEEFITQTNHNTEDAKEETAALHPPKMNADNAHEIDEEGQELDQSEDKPQTGKTVQTEEKKKNEKVKDINH